MRNLSANLTALGLAAGALLASSGALAAPVVSGFTLGGQSAIDGSFLTSAKVASNNKVTSANFNGFFIETFDYATRMFAGEGALDIPGLQVDSTLSNRLVDIVGNNGCAYNGFNATNATTTGGGLGVRKGGLAGVAGNPAGDNTCFGYVPGTGSSGSLSFNYTNIMNSGLVPLGASVNYIGFYLGSLDTYNSIDLLTSTGAVAYTINSTNLLNGLTGGSWTSATQNQYVNLSIDPNANIRGMTFRSTAVAFELDNVVVGFSAYNNVPEPESLALVGLGLLGLAAARRRKQTA